MERYPGEWNVDRRGGQWQNSPPERRVQRGRGGREVRSSSLIVFRAPPVRPGGQGVPPNINEIEKEGNEVES
ncbi:hypothetical protein JOQ06_013069 [Pogonophryne albipinna]|uniref:Uncharacterized protein n=1 Tax=Pogonophryne albipinna TaxID=1090488 RepID=A0AAD6FT53_9TELE|nr:hypothetical protein JOQ06_013069 [Pogonophryne albipinna]